MKIKKLGHCCLIIEENGKRVMTDPGSYTVEEQVKERGIDLILITHEHGDHIHVESLKKILENNPDVKIITNSGVGKLLDEAGIKYEILENKVMTNVLGIELEAHDCKHEEIFEEYGQVQNTAFFIGKRLFYPGDAFYNPGKLVEILALPIAGSWSRVKNAINYALEIKPMACFPVHDGMLSSPKTFYAAPNVFLSKFGIIFKIFKDKDEEEF